MGFVEFAAKRRRLGGGGGSVDLDAAMEALMADGAHMALDTQRIADFWQGPLDTNQITATGQSIAWADCRFGTTTYDFANGSANATVPTYDTDGYILFARASSQVLFGEANILPISNAAPAMFVSCSVWINSIPGISVLVGVGSVTTTLSRFTIQLNADGSVTLNARRQQVDANATATSAAGVVTSGGYYTISGQAIAATGEMKVWVNGVEVATGTMASTAATFEATDSTRLRLGASVSSAAQYFDGYMCRPVLLRKSLSDADRATVEEWGAGIRSYSVGKIVASGVRTWFNSPSGARIGTKIYVSQVNDNVAITLSEWDYSLNKARVVHTTSATVFNGDDHNDGGVAVLANGNLLWMPVDHKGDDLRAVLGLPGSFTDNNLQAQIGSTDYSYSQIVQLEGETNAPIYCFTRIGVRDNWMIKSEDGGVTWSALQQQFSNLTSDRPYPQYCKISSTEIGVLITDAHPDEAAFNTSVYFARRLAGQWNEADGTSLGALPIEVTTLTKIFDGPTNDPSWTWDLKRMGSEMVGLFASFPTYDAHRYHRTVIQDDGTFVNEVIYSDAGYSLYGAAPNTQQAYSGGMALHPTNKDIVYACISKLAVRSGKHQLYRLERDGGGTWNETQLTDTDDEWFRPDTAGGHLTVCYGPYSSYTSNVGCRMLGIII